MNCQTLADIRENIARAAEHSGRNPEEITLVAVSKRQSMEKIRSLVECGQSVFGENYLQEAREKITELESPGTNWHMIGHLQSNKARAAVELFDMIETVDSLKLARALDRHAAALGRSLQVLIQVNIGREPQKYGVLPEKSEELLRQIGGETGLDVRGLMGMPPRVAAPEAARPFFRELRHLGQRLADRGLFSGLSAPQLSMGMSADYPVAIEEGATLVRVGTALFGRRE